MEQIKIVYIDDAPDAELSKYLYLYRQEGYDLKSRDIEFNPEEGYDSLIRNPDVISANIIFIDSRLFENRTADQGRFTGEEFKIILKKQFPFIEVIVITQNEIQPEYSTIAKYSPIDGKTAQEYYSELIPSKIELAIKNIHESREILLNIKENKNWESVLVEKISNSLNGCGKYDELKKDDIDIIINLFRELERKVNGK